MELTQLNIYIYIYIYIILYIYIYIHVYICISYNMDTSALPDMYARSARATGPRAEGMHIRQSTRAHVITNMLHFWHS